MIFPLKEAFGKIYYNSKIILKYDFNFYLILLLIYFLQNALFINKDAVHSLFKYHAFFFHLFPLKSSCLESNKLK
jgi:hypothetical protein